MIKSVKVTNYLNESIELELANPEKSGFYISNIEGLGPPTAMINMTEMATSDGAVYNSARAATRNIVLSLGFLFQPNIETIRQLSYKYFPIKKKLKLTITTDNRIGEIFGFVESNEPVIFSSRQTTQISILCPDPYFYAKKITTTRFAGVVPLFEFPFFNESLTGKLLEMGNMYTSTTQTIFYEGDAEVGVIINIYAFGPVSNVLIYDPSSDRKMEINTTRMADLTGSGIIEGDRITISTVRGDKFIVLNRDGVDINILNCLNRDAYWFQLVKGDNLFAYIAEFGMANLDFRIDNRTIYEGV